jgi:hypothetical protein
MALSLPKWCTQQLYQADHTAWLLESKQKMAQLQMFDELRRSALSRMHHQLTEDIDLGHHAAPLA